MTSNIPYGYCHCGCGQKTELAPRTQTAIGWKRGEPKRYINHHQVRARKPFDPKIRFWSKVAITANPDLCWEWQAAILSSGYGSFSPSQQKSVVASRYAWELTNGEIPNGLFVLHKCDNRKCCNPNHLFLGTQQDNMDDMKTKGRSRKGENHGRHKLTEQQAIDILQHGNKHNTKELAKQYNISVRHCRAILRGENWLWLKEKMHAETVDNE